MGSFYYQKGQNLAKRASQISQLKKKIQQSAGAQIDTRCDTSLSGIEDKVKRIINETVKNQSIKKEALMFDLSLLDCDLTATTDDTQTFSQSFSHSVSQPETIDLRSPANFCRTKK